MKTLSRRALNRSLLARQFLLQRVEKPALDVVTHLVGMQCQQPDAPYVGLWTRVEGFRQQELVELLESRACVRTSLMRHTLHLVSAGDCVVLQPLMEPVIQRATKGTFGKWLTEVDVDAMVKRARVLVEKEPMTLDALGKELAKKWPVKETMALSQMARARMRMVQVTPRGIWNVGGLAKFTTTEKWLGKGVKGRLSVENLVLRYLRAFGPASVRDVQAWCGLTRLDVVMKKLRPSLEVFLDEDGVELFDLPDAPRPDEDVAAPVRFMPDFDNVFLAHHDRRRVIPEPRKSKWTPENTRYMNGVLVDGFFKCAWKMERSRKRAHIEVLPFDRLTRGEKNAISDEGMALLEWAEPAADERDVRFLDAL